ncbi:MAG: YkgJ family cysteine cluster protein [Streptosporangiaceae bacterium]
MRHSETDAALQELYDQVPRIPDCQGHCWLSCGPVPLSDRERQRIRAAGYRITDEDQARAQVQTYWCEALGPDGRCRVYAIRPMICRIWGTVESLRCPWGCMPEGGFMPDEQGYRLLVLAHHIGGSELSMLDASKLEGAFTTPQMTATLNGLVEQARRGDWIRQAHYGTELPEAVTSRSGKRRQ